MNLFDIYDLITRLSYVEFFEYLLHYMKEIFYGHVNPFPVQLFVTIIGGVINDFFKKDGYRKLKINNKIYQDYCVIGLRNNNRHFLDSDSFVKRSPILHFPKPVKMTVISNNENTVELKYGQDLELVYLDKTSSIELKISPPCYPKVIAKQKGVKGKLEVDNIIKKYNSWFSYSIVKTIKRILNLFVISFCITSLLFWGLRSFRLPKTVWNELLARFAYLQFSTFLIMFLFFTFYTLLLRPERLWNIKKVFNYPNFSKGRAA